MARVRDNRQVGLPLVQLSAQAAPEGTEDGKDVRAVFPIPESTEAPKEFRIFPKGMFDTRKGKFLFDDESAQSVMGQYKDQGNELHLDYEHQALVSPPVKAPAAGWFKPELRDDGLWATNVRWTPEAEKHLKGKEYRYFSPAFDSDPKSGRVLRLINVALTNLPATKKMTPLVAAREIALAAQFPDELGAKAMKFKLSIKASSKKLSHKALRSALTLLDEGADDADATVDARAMQKALATALVGMLDDGGGDADAMSAVLKKLDDDGDADDMKLKCLRALSALLDDGDSDAMKAALKKLGGYPDSKDVDVGAPVYKRQTQTHLDACPDGVKPSPIATGPAPNTMSERALQEQLKLTSEALSDVVALTGRGSTAEALGTIAGWKQSAEQVPSLQARIQQVELTERNRQFDTLLDSAKRAGRISPSFAASQHIKDMRQKPSSLIELKSLVESLPPVAHVVEELQQAKVEHAIAGEEVTLTAEDRRYSEITGATSEEILKHKQRRQQRIAR